ncbi:MAG: bifunctional helix-turn-helix domain-containing protein/methylated-DNA--[protein]-cysteine S-methyltransferase [Candidatus Thiodiazotropha sp.]
MPDTYTTVALAIDFIRQHALHQPSLAEVADAVGLSESHLQRTFHAWAGISPKRFLQFLTKEYALSRLRESADLLNLSLDIGLSGPGRLHDLMVTSEALTPGEIKRGGGGMELRYGQAACPFGNALVAWSERGVCHLSFHEAGNIPALAVLSQSWPHARFANDQQAAERLMSDIFPTQPGKRHLHLLLKGSNFQLKVWEALLGVGSAQIATYSTLARLAGQPKAHRSVGTALAANRIAYLIPCHRIIRSNGAPGTYHWGGTRKLAMLAWEGAQADPPKQP